MPLKVREVRSALTSKGFKLSEKDHHFYYLYQDGKKTQIRTKVSHGESEIGDPTCGLMARQMKLTGPQFREFVDCKLKSEEYVELLIKGAHLQKSTSS